MSEKKINILDKSSILLFTGIRRLSAKIEKRKIDKIYNGKIEGYLKNINDITKNALSEFTKKEMNLKKIGKLMNLYWEQFLLSKIEQHFQITQSNHAKNLLDNWEKEKFLFWQVHF